MKFRVFNDYEQDEQDIIQPVLDSGYRDIEIDWENEHKYFYLRLANCFKVGEDLEVIAGEDIQGNIEEVISNYGNLGCSPIERKLIEKFKVGTIKPPPDWVLEVQKADIFADDTVIYDETEKTFTKYVYEPISRRSPSRRDIKTNTLIANGDLWDWERDIKESNKHTVDLQSVNTNPSLPKALLDLTILVKQFELGLEVNLELLESHLIQSNVISVTKRDIVNGHQVYKTVPNVDNLLGLAFWQFQQLLLENNPDKIAVCAMCGNYFEKKSHKGRFCNETITGAYGEQTKLNACTSRYNSLKNRVKKNYVKDASLTINDLAKKHRCSIELIAEFVEQWEKDGIQRNEL